MGDIFNEQLQSLVDETERLDRRLITARLERSDYRQPKMRIKRWNDPRRNMFKLLWEHGTPVKEIMHYTGMAQVSINQERVRQGLPVRRGRRGTQVNTKMVAFYISENDYRGLRVHTMANKTKISIFLRKLVNRELMLMAQAKGAGFNPGLLI